MSTRTTGIETPVEVSPFSREWRHIAKTIDHTLLKPEATREQIVRLCAEAVQYGCASVCVNQTWLTEAVAHLRGSGVAACTTIGFPLGAVPTSVKRLEAAESIRAGATELDMVLNVGALKSGDRTLVVNDIRGVVEIAHEAGALVKVILETSLLNIEEKVVSCELSVAAGADFVKTSTGFAGGGATVDDIHLMRGVVHGRAKVKASGGIRNLADALTMLDAGADRLGTSSGVKILQEAGAK